MTNVALGKPIEEAITNPASATDGQITHYTDRNGFAEFNWPHILTVDLGNSYDLFCIRVLLWDGLGEGSRQRDSRVFKYRLLTSLDHQTWKVIFDSSNDPGNGWQVFNFPNPLNARYIRLHGLWNSANTYFQVVQIEAHDSEPPDLDAEIILQRTSLTESLEEETGDGLPLQARVEGIINGIERLIEGTELLNPKPFRELISQLRVQVRDVTSLERGMDSIRREIISPVHNELERSAKLGRFSVWGFWVGLIGGILAIISIALALIQWSEPKSVSSSQSSATPQVQSTDVAKAALDQAPKSFFINSTYAPTGNHLWSRTVQDTWIEQYNSRILFEFRVSARITVDNCLGSLSYKASQPEYEIFIPDKDCPTMNIQQRLSRGAWTLLGEMKGIQ